MRRRVGVGVVVAGIVLVTIGLIGWQGERTPVASVPDPTTAAPSTTTVTYPTTTVTSPTTTGTPPTTTGDQGSADEQIRDFLVEFVTALDGDDVEFLMSSLHPSVVTAYGEELCRSWISGEVVELSDYELAGPTDGPETQELRTPTGSVTITRVHSAPVSFTFSGQVFESVAAFSVEDGSVHWLGTCRQP